MNVEPQPVTGRWAMEIAEITYRQLNYFARTELVPPDVPPVSPHGRPRYSFTAVTRLALLKRLLDLGASFPEIKRVLSEGPTGLVRPVPHLAMDLGPMWEGVTEEVRDRMIRSRGPYDDSG
jgi:DNA-binding transcriptional MerR regulator